MRHDMKKIKFTIGTDGKTKLEVIGAVGDSCLEFTEVFETRLGVPDGERILKDECFETETETEQDYEVGT